MVQTCGPGLFLQIVEENKNLWKLRNGYRKDIKRYDDCDRFWEELESEKEKQIASLEVSLKDVSGRNRHRKEKFPAD
jgi:hypothetical protein